MKKNLVLFLLAVLVMACKEGAKIIVEIENTSAIDRTEEVVEVEWNNFQSLQTNSVVVLDDKGTEVPSQILYYGEEKPVSLIFPVNVTAGSKVSYSVRAGVPSEFPQKTFGRKVPERKDDFAWENDRVAFRVYGPALANENPSNGIDFWLKKTSNLIVDKFYKEELENGKSYHVDRGEGLDCYKVGHTLGAGGIAPYADGKIWVGNHYTTVKVLDSGILRTTFALTYDSLLVGEDSLLELKRISLDAGSQLCKAFAVYKGDFETMDVAAGIYLHNELGNIQADKENGYIAYAENAVSDAGVPAGRNYVGVVFTAPVKEIYQDTEHVAGIVSCEKEKPVEYYFGGGWSQWGFDSDEAWFEYMKNFASKIKEPLKIELIY